MLVEKSLFFSKEEVPFLLKSSSQKQHIVDK